MALLFDPETRSALSALYDIVYLIVHITSYGTTDTRQFFNVSLFCGNFLYILLTKIIFQAFNDTTTQNVCGTENHCFWFNSQRFCQPPFCRVKVKDHADTCRRPCFPGTDLRPSNQEDCKKSQIMTVHFMSCDLRQLNRA